MKDVHESLCNHQQCVQLTDRARSRYAFLGTSWGTSGLQPEPVLAVPPSQRVLSKHEIHRRCSLNVYFVHAPYPQSVRRNVQVISNPTLTVFWREGRCREDIGQ